MTAFILINMRIFQLLNFNCQATSLKFLSLKFSQGGPPNFTTCNISLVLDNIKRCLRYKSNDLKVQKWFKKLILSKTNEIFRVIRMGGLSCINEFLRIICH